MHIQQQSVALDLKQVFPADITRPLRAYDPKEDTFLRRMWHFDWRRLPRDVAYLYEDARTFLGMGRLAAAYRAVRMALPALRRRRVGSPQFSGVASFPHIFRYPPHSIVTSTPRPPQ